MIWRALYLELLEVRINSIQGEAEKERKDGVSSDQGPGESQPSTTMAYQCKPDLSCWSYLPPAIVEKGSKIKKYNNIKIIHICTFVERCLQNFIFSWFWSDMIKTHLFWIKLIFFFQSGSLVVLYPYLVIHMRSLGLSVEEVFIILALIMKTFTEILRLLWLMESSLLLIS